MSKEITPEEIAAHKRLLEAIKARPEVGEPQEVPVDVFKRKEQKIVMLNEDNPGIIIQFGKDVQDTVIKTAGGEQIMFVTKVSIDLDAEYGIQTATLTILNPKIIGSN